MSKVSDQHAGVKISTKKKMNRNISETTKQR